MAVEPTLQDVLQARGIETHGMLALRVALHPADATNVFQTTADVMKAGQLSNYMRMQEGRRLGPDNLVLCFAEEPFGTARLFDVRRFRARRPGIAPGDLVYDPDLVDLLQNFIGRTKRPTFYDVFEPDARLEKAYASIAGFFNSLVVHWPAPVARIVRKVGHGGLRVVAPAMAS